jgi:spermidine/putrescine transport system permease protein
MLYNEFTVLMGLIMYLLPFMVLNIYVSLEGIDKSLLEAARCMGCTEWQAFREVTLPLSLPGVSAGCLLVFVLTAGTYLPPMILGGPGNDMIANLIFKRVIGTLDWPFGSAISVILLSLLFVIVWTYNRYLGINQIFKSFAGKLDHETILTGMDIDQDLHVSRLRVSCSPPSSWSSCWHSTPSSSAFSPWRASACAGSSNWPRMNRSSRRLKNSLILGSLTAVISTGIGILAALAFIRFEFPGKNTLNTLLLSPIMIPEVVLGVALLLFLRFLQQPKSFALLLIGHVVLTLPYVLLIVQARLVGIKKEYEEAAKSLGANAFQTFREVTFPLLLPAILAGALFAFTISFDDITATLFWATAQNQTVPVKIFSMLRNSISPEINALGAVMIVLTVTTPCWQAICPASSQK